MKLDEIFKNKPELLQEDEVKDLIKYCEAVFKKQLARIEEYKAFHDKVFEELIHSELVLKNGAKGKDVVQALLKISDEYSFL